MNFAKNFPMFRRLISNYTYTVSRAPGSRKPKGPRPGSDQKFWNRRNRGRNQKSRIAGSTVKKFCSTWYFSSSEEEQSTWFFSSSEEEQWWENRQDQENKTTEEDEDEDGATGGVEGSDSSIFVGGLPCYFTEVQIRSLLESFGPLRRFDLVKDQDTGNSKGYYFCVYQDPAVIDIACATLNRLKVLYKTLTVRRATASGQATDHQENILQQAQQHVDIQKMVLHASGSLPGGVGVAAEVPTKIVRLTEVVTVDELRDDVEYNAILEDMREEGSKFGSLVNVVIPRQDANGEWSPGVGKVFLEYADDVGSARAKTALHGRKIGGKDVEAVYYPEEQYSNRDYGA